MSSKKTLQDSQMSASTFTSQTAAHYGRLNSMLEKGGNGNTISVGGWCATSQDRYQWLQVRFNDIMRISAVITQGRQDADEWVTSYKLQYSVDGSSWNYYPNVSKQVLE